MRFLHCSDVHITDNYFEIPFFKLGWRRWIAMMELTFGGRAKAYAHARSSLSQIVADARTHEVDHFILSGDLTAYALEGEFEGARAALGPLADDKERCTVIPGNHDVYTPGSFQTRRFERYFGHLLESDLPEHRREGPFPFVRLLGREAAVVGLKSARVPGFPGLSFGVIGKKQLDGLRAIVADPRLDGRAILVVVHHAPMRANGTPDRFFHGLMDADELFALLPGDRFAVLHGHIHQRYHHHATDTRPHVFGAGSSTEKDHEGYWVIETRGGKVVGGEPHSLSTR
jgi:3',5'-cyclic AMP phosphodiesterase CpdA